MVARRAWVITIELLDAAVYVGAGNDNTFTRVLAVLRPRTRDAEIITFMRRLYAVFSLDVDEQLADLGRSVHESNALIYVSNGGGVDISLFSQPIHLRAQKSNVYRTEERDDGEYLDWRPDGYSVYEVNPDTFARTLIEERTFLRRAERKAAIDRHALFA